MDNFRRMDKLELTELSLELTFVSADSVLLVYGFMNCYLKYQYRL